MIVDSAAMSCLLEPVVRLNVSVMSISYAVHGCILVRQEGWCIVCLHTYSTLLCIQHIRNC